jgi:hypothetical protein
MLTLKVHLNWPLLSKCRLHRPPWPAESYFHLAAEVGVAAALAVVGVAARVALAAVRVALAAVARAQYRVEVAKVSQEDRERKNYKMITVHPNWTWTRNPALIASVLYL